MNAIPLRAKRAIWLFIAYWLVQLGVGLVGGVGAGMYAAFTFSSAEAIDAFINDVALFPLTLAAILAAGAVVFAIVRSSFPGRIRDGAFAPMGWTPAPVAYAILAAILGGGLAFGYLNFGIVISPPSPTQDFGPIATAAAAATAGDGITWAALVWAAILLLAAPIEEFLFRGAMLTGFTRSFGTVAASVIVTVLFVGSHLFETNFYYPAILSIALMAVLTLIARLWTGSLVAPICIHGAYNLVIVVEAFQ